MIIEKAYSVPISVEYIGLEMNITKNFRIIWGGPVKAWNMLEMWRL